MEAHEIAIEFRGTLTGRSVEHDLAADPYLDMPTLTGVHVRATVKDIPLERIRIPILPKVVIAGPP